MTALSRISNRRISNIQNRGKGSVMAKYCGKCGSKLDEKTGLCPQCDDINPKQHKSRKGIMISIVLLIIVVGGCLIAFFVFKDNFFLFKSQKKCLFQFT